jgi:acyl dehydratase
MPLHVRAVNTASDSENKIHDDSVAAAYGFRGGLVPGVTVYGYMASAVIDHLGREWLNRGAMDVRFQHPVYEGDDVEVAVEPESDGRIRVFIADRATATAWIGDHPHPTTIPYAPLARRKASRESLMPGTVLGAWTERLDLAQSTISAPLDSSIDGHAHPAVLLALANRIFVENYELGPWIHVSSEVRKFRAVKDGENIQVHAQIADAYEKKGHEFVVLDAVLDGVLGGISDPIEYIRHTAIWRPRQ